MPKRILVCIAAVFALNFLLITPVDAQTATPAPSIIDQEARRNELLVKDLSLKLPGTTDDPNQTITFIPPVKNQDVSIQVDAQVYEKAKSPFVLPALSVGQHTITFKFKNKQGVLQVLTQNLVVIPKAPEFAASLPTESKVDQIVTLSGTAIPNASIQLVQNSQHVLTASTNNNGEWSLSSKELISGKNNFIAIVIKNGFASNFSKPYNITAGSRPIVETVTAPQVSALTQLRTYFNQASRWVQNHQQETLIAVGAAALSVVTVFFFRWLSHRKQASDEKTIAEILQNRQVKGEPTITEKLKQQADESVVIASTPAPTPKTRKAPAKPAPAKKKEPKPVKQPQPKVKPEQPVPPAVSPPPQDDKSVANVLEQADQLLDSTPIETPPAKEQKKKLSREEFLKRFKKS